jgi:hypothetical protein
MFNPIGKVFADLKRSIRTSLSTTMRAEVLGIHNLPWEEKVGARRRLFTRALDIAFQSISLEQVELEYITSFLKSLTEKSPFLERG